jgi:hypothetical protein
VVSGGSPGVVVVNGVVVVGKVVGSVVGVVGRGDVGGGGVITVRLSHVTYSGKLHQLLFYNQ